MGKLEDMETFVRIVEAGSISRAAEQMEIAKSAVSRRLIDLETRLNAQLIKRTTRKSTLTDAGKSFYSKALQILADVNELHSSTSDEIGELQGGIKIALPYSFGLLHMAPLLNEFASLHPQLDLHMTFSDHQTDLLAENVDVAIRIANLESSSHVARKLTAVNFSVCASPQYLKTNGTPLTHHDLKSHANLNYDNSVGSSRKFIDPNGREISVRLPVKISADNGDFLCQAAIAGLGITVLPTFIASEAIKSGKLVCLLEDYKLPSLNAYAIYPQTRHLSRRVRALIDFLVEKFSGVPAWDI